MVRMTLWSYTMLTDVAEEGEMAAEGGIRDRLTRRHEDYWNRKSCASELRYRMGEVWGAILGVHSWSVVWNEWTRER